MLIFKYSAAIACATVASFEAVYLCFFRMRQLCEYLKRKKVPKA